MAKKSSGRKRRLKRHGGGPRSTHYSSNRSNPSKGGISAGQFNTSNRASAPVSSGKGKGKGK